MLSSQSHILSNQKEVHFQFTRFVRHTVMCNSIGISCTCAINSDLHTHLLCFLNNVFPNCYLIHSKFFNFYHFYSGWDYWLVKCHHSAVATLVDGNTAAVNCCGAQIARARGASIQMEILLCCGGGRANSAASSFVPFHHTKKADELRHCLPDILPFTAPLCHFPTCHRNRRASS